MLAFSTYIAHNRGMTKTILNRCKCGAVNGKDFYAWVDGVCPACAAEEEYELDKINGVYRSNFTADEVSQAMAIHGG